MYHTLLLDALPIEKRARNKPLMQGAKICVTIVVSTVADDALNAR
jgi:hypothetical protein